MNTYKSLESYKYVTSGLVFNVGIKSICRGNNKNNFLVVARVRQEQSMFTKTPNYTWLLGLESDGAILNAHCMCMAGLGEVCSHVEAVMFYLSLTAEYCKRNLNKLVLQCHVPGYHQEVPKK